MGPAILIAFLSIPAAAMASAVALGIAFASTGASFDVDTVGDWILEYIATPRGLATLLVPVQACFLLCAVVPALLSPVPIGRRLGLSLGRVGIDGALAIALGTAALTIPLAIGLSALVRWLGIEPEDDLIEGMFLAPTGTDALLVCALLSILPAIGEEFLFRGYLLRRLVRRWSPGAAIVTSSFLFSLAHLNPLQATVLIPLGLWLGFVVWRTGSIWPAVGAHTVNNTVAFILAREAGGVLEGEPTALSVTIGAFGIAVVCALYGLGRMSHLPAPPPPEG